MAVVRRYNELQELENIDVLIDEFDKSRYITISESVSISDALSILSGRARAALAYLTKRVSDGEFTIRANNSDITKRTASIRTDEY